jgi:hypothetical protein
MSQQAQAERFKIKVNGQILQIGDVEPSGHGVLNRADFRPVEEHLLLYRKRSGELEEIGLEETVNLERDGVEEFFAFRSDRFLYFTLDGRRYPWGEAKPSTVQLRDIGQVGADREIWQERKGEPDLKLEEDGHAKLNGDGVEAFYTKPREAELVCVKLDGEEKRIKAGDYTTETLKAALGVAPTLALDIIENGVLRPLADGEHIRVVAKMKFVSHERQGGSA